MLLACMISLGFYGINTVAKGEIIQCNEQSAHSRVHIISIKSKIRILDHKFPLPDNLAWSLFTRSVDSSDYTGTVEFK